MDQEVCTELILEVGSGGVIDSRCEGNRGYSISETDVNRFDDSACRSTAEGRKEVQDGI